MLTPGLAAETLSNVLRKTFPASEFTKTRQTERIKSRQNNRDSSMIKPELSGIVPCLVRSLYLATGSDILVGSVVVKSVVVVIQEGE